MCVCAVDEDACVLACVLIKSQNYAVSVFIITCGFAHCLICTSLLNLKVALLLQNINSETTKAETPNFFSLHCK